MSLSSVPDLFPCPHCGVELPHGDGPEDLVWHGCVPPEPAEGLMDPRALLTEAIHTRDPAPRRLAVEAARVLLTIAEEDPTQSNQMALAIAVKNLTELDRATSGTDSGPDDALLAFIQGGRRGEAG